MKNGKKYRVLFTTTDSLKSAELISKKLVELNLVACVNILPNVISIYKWNNKIETSNELILMIKTTKRKIHKIEEKILELHHYSTPEIISLKIDKGNKKYLKWINDSINNNNK